MSIKARHVGIGMTSRRTRERLVQRLKDEGISDPRVLEAIRQVPRHIFVDEALASRAYEDTALPIGHGQTISQPYIVARMTELVIAEGECKSVLEIGTGCGYQTAILSHFFEKVYTVERLSALLDGARRRFADLSLRNIRPRLTDGSAGWASHAPFDAIIATGSNNSARYFEHYFKGKPNIIRKNRNSIAVISGNETDLEMSDL